jgi:hypothetical protein
MGPLKFRFFSARIGNAFYVATKERILEELAALDARNQGKPRAADGGESAPAGHAMLRIRAANWNQILGDYRLGWAENNRRACLNNLGPLSDVSRAYFASDSTRRGDGKQLGPRLLEKARRHFGKEYSCPDGGAYIVSADGRSVACSIHGSARAPAQNVEPRSTSPISKLMENLDAVTATLTFQDDGLRAVLTVQRKAE